MTQTVPIHREDGSRGTRTLVWVAVALATLGAVVTAVMLVRAVTAPDPLAVGTPVDTEYGSFTVTRISTTFVPATQGPPTAAKMMGTKGDDQLQVWVRFVNDDAPEGLRYSPDDLQLVTGGPAGRATHPAQGSTLEPGSLPQGASIDGQVWFDLDDVAPKAPRWLVHTAADGSVIRVPLPLSPRTASPGHGPSHH
jgi:hypothetical protein